MCKVSIVIPVYNVQQYLEECLESVTRQTLQDIEILCVNDGSTDGSLKLLEKAAGEDSRIVVIDQPNGGYGKAMNAGLDKARGEYIGIVEPDDYVALSMFEDLYLAAQKEALDFVKSDFYRFRRSENGDMQLFYEHLSASSGDYGKVFDPSHEPERLNYVMNTWCGIYRRAFLVENGIRHNETPGAAYQDTGFWFQTFAFAKRAMILPGPRYYNRRDNPNSSVFDSGKVYNTNREFDYIRRVLKAREGCWERFCYIYWRKKYASVESTLARIGNADKREYVMRASREFRRADQQGELRRTAFTNDQWAAVQLLMKDPEGYYYTVLYTGDEEAMRLKKSPEYRVGSLIAGGPVRAKNLVKKALKMLK